MNLVSIITPSYNSEDFISETIKSVLSQTYQNWEMIIIDDCSNDGSVGLIKKNCEKDNRIILIEQKKNIGAGEARNIGLKKANGRYIAFLDSDDCWLPNKLEIQINFMKKHKSAISFTSYIVMNELFTKEEYTINVPQKITYTGYLKNTIIGMSSSIIDKNIVGDINFLDIRTRQDTYLWISLLKRGLIANGLDIVLMKYRKRDSSISANKFKAAKRVWYLYYNLEELGFFKSLYYFIFYAINAIRKRK